MTKNILLIEDGTTFANLLIEKIKSDGRFIVTHCKSHIDAEALLSTNKDFAAIISDGDTGSYHEPNKPTDGVDSDVVKFLTKNANASLPVIVLTGSPETIDAVKNMPHNDVKNCVLKGSPNMVTELFSVLDQISPPVPSQIKR